MAFNVQQLPLKLLSEISFQIETEGAKVLTGFSNALRLEMIKNAKSIPLSKNPWYVTPNENFRETPFVRPSKRIPKKAKLGMHIFLNTVRSPMLSREKEVLKNGCDMKTNLAYLPV